MIGLILFLAMLSGQARPGAALPSTYRIRGIVVDAANGGTVASAEVSILAEGDEIKVTANGDGSFDLEGLPAGKYPLYAWAQGYLREGLNQHGGFFTGVVVGPGLDSEHVVFRLHRAALIYGTVRDERGDPVRQAEVLLFEAENDQNFQKRETWTNDLGEYRFANLTAGTYRVAVRARPWYADNGFRYAKEGLTEFANGASAALVSNARPASTNSLLDVAYPITFYPEATDERSAGDINLAVGEKEEANIAMRAVQAVHIRLTGLPRNVPGFSVNGKERLFGSIDAYDYVTFATIAPGEYEVTGLPPGNLTLTVTMGQGDKATSEVIKAKLSDGDSVDLADAGARAKVTGRAIFPNGGGREATVRLTNQQGEVVGTKLQKDGTFSFAAVQEGSYKVGVDEMNGGAAYVAKIVATGAEVSGREITIEGTGDVGLSVAVGEGLGMVAGTAKLNGKAEGGAMILLVPESEVDVEDEARMDQSDSDGTFTLANVVPGKYVLMAIEDGWGLKWRDKVQMKPYREKGQVLQIGANQKMDVSVEVQRKMK